VLSALGGHQRLAVAARPAEISASTLDNGCCRCCDNFLYVFKGAPSARHAYGRNRLCELARATGGEQNGRVTSDKRQGSPGVSPSLGGSFRRALRAEALRRDELPRTAAPAPAAAGPRRHAPMPCHTSRARPSRSRRERR
jgi:hypothetical protein